MSNPKLLTLEAKLLLFLLVTAGVIAGCASGINTTQVATPTISVVYKIDPPIREFYEYYGGVQVFGEPLSELVEQAGNKFQFTTAALWVVDSQASADQFVRLAPLGASIIPPDKQDPAEPPPPTGDPYYDNGHYIYEAFRGLYDRLGGKKMVGRPLTSVRYEALTDRYEQYFENLGFYVSVGTPSQPGLLSYGAWLCNNQCRNPQQLNGAIQHSPAINPPFDVVVARLGREFTGEPLAMAANSSDGRLEQVFANLVLVADASDPANPDLVTTRPIVDKLGILPSPMVASSAQPDMYFYEVSNGQGYNIPLEFKALLDQHGGFQYSGVPVNELAQINNRIYRQCFRNLCLDNDPTAPAHLRIRPAPLGVDYLKSNLRSPVQPTVASQSFSHMTIQVWEAQDRVASNQEQEIFVTVSENGQPLSGIQPVLVVHLPNGNEDRYDLPATAADGRSNFKIPPIAAANGILVPYEVCVPQAEQMFCVRQEYLILNMP